MEGYLVEKQFNSSSFLCVAIMGPLGHRCGYVGVSKSHPLYGIEYSDETLILRPFIENVLLSSTGKRGIISVLLFSRDDIPRPDFIFDVHGSLTYSGFGSGNYPINSDLWWLGFDCAHSGDAPDPNWSESIYPLNWGALGGTVRSLRFVMDECVSLAKQLKDVEDYYTGGVI